MKKIIALGFACALAAVLQAGMDDSLLTFSTKGPDKYADGTTVLDGECYALVWTKSGATFAGFAADGKTQAATDQVVLVAPVAKGGCCPTIVYQIPAETVTSLGAGTWGVYLLDTRVTANGKTAVQGLKNGMLQLVNGSGAVTTAKLAGTAAGFATASAETTAVTTGVAAPADVAQPQIKAIALEGDNVKITVQNLPGFMRVQTGSTVKADEVQGAAQATDGKAEDVILYMPKTEAASGFFRVIRNK